MGARKFKSKPTKSDFVRAMSNAKASEIVAAAKSEGIKLTERYVYVIRSSDKARARERGLAPTGRGRGRRATSSAGAEAQMRRAIAELGLATSRAILREVEAAFSR